MKKYFDVTLDLFEGMKVYPGDPKVMIGEHVSLSSGDSCNVSTVFFGSHTGTHIDAPKHFFENGMTIDKIPLEYLVGKAKVFEIIGKNKVTFEDIKLLDIQKNDIIIFKTRNTELLGKEEFDTGFTFISSDAADYLVKRGIKTLGVDYLSVEEFGSSNCEVHLKLLGNDIIIIEGLDLKEISEGLYEIIALPIKIRNGNGAPARVLLARE